MDEMRPLEFISRRVVLFLDNALVGPLCGEPLG